MKKKANYANFMLHYSYAICIVSPYMCVCIYAQYVQIWVVFFFFSPITVGIA